MVFDSLYARARAALAWDGMAPDLLPPGAQELEIVYGRHPLLLASGAEDGRPIRPEPGTRGAGLGGFRAQHGREECLPQSLGLIATLAQSGVIPPVGEGTRLPVFTNVFADIGDEQSITESLSTFSAHLANLKEIVSEADPESLVLIDEMGTGTDPQEGAALSRAILEELVERGALTVVTSHLGALKRLDTPGSGVVNASLQFDPDRIEPTYQLLKGRPGRSYGLAIARRLGFPPESPGSGRGPPSQGGGPNGGTSGGSGAEGEGGLDSGRLPLEERARAERLRRGFGRGRKISNPGRDRPSQGPGGGPASLAGGETGSGGCDSGGTGGR